MARNISVLFPGQGSQYNGMGKDFLLFLSGGKRNI